MDNHLKRKLLLGLLLICSITAISFAYMYREDRPLIYRLVPQITLAMARTPTDAMQLGYFFFNNGGYDLATAKKAFVKALVLSSTTPQAHYQLARVAFIQGNLFEALQEIDTEIAINPALPNSFYVRGLIEGYLNEYDLAEKDFSVFIQKMPDVWAGYNDLAWVEIKSHKYAKAKETIEQGFAKHPELKTRNPWMWTSLGVANLNLQSYENARVAFTHAEEISNGMTAEYFWSAYPGNSMDEASTNFNAFRASLHFNIALTYEKEDRLQEAVREYQNYLTLMPNDTDVKAKIASLEARSAL